MPNTITICLDGSPIALRVSVNRAQAGHRFAVLEGQDFTILWPVFEGAGAEVLRTFAQQCLEAAAELSGPADAF